MTALVSMSDVNVEVQQKDDSKELGRVGKVMAALEEIGTPEAIANRDKLSGLMTGWQHLAEKVDEQKAQKDRKVRLALMVKMVMTAVDGFRAVLGFMDPELSRSLPKSSGLEKEDPLGFATTFCGLIEGHGPRTAMMVKDLKAIVSRVREEQGQVKESGASLAQLEDEAKVARLHMREFQSACERFITTNTPKDHKARAHLKVKRNKSDAAKAKADKAAKDKAAKEAKPTADTSKAPQPTPQPAAPTVTPPPAPSLAVVQKEVEKVAA